MYFLQIFYENREKLFHLLLFKYVISYNTSHFCQILLYSRISI